MRVIEKIDLKQLYEIDDDLWLEETIDLLKERKFNELDLENLIEELENLGKRDKLAVGSLLEQIIRHILLLTYWDIEYERNHRHWKAEIKSFRKQLKKGLTTNLKNYLANNLEEIYQEAIDYVQVKSNLNIFPLECSYTLDQLLDDDWFPPVNNN
ncbi:DUF29 domain-containing protein [Geminocystis sp. CENA526]|uniref:DUF29 domain-containing protein n=1 Tax=Geminocystis sp. CENA526 TaxID=1355871 RepID=UPI003D6E57FD